LTATITTVHEAIAQFLDVARADPKLRRRLERLLRDDTRDRPEPTS
jgi:hypothetical protein